MNLFLKSTTLFLLLAATILSCGKVEDADNVIKDPEGILVELTWSNDAANPAIGTDLELFVRQNFNSLIQSTNYNAFEDLSITPGILNDGLYNLDVYVDDIDRITTYTITVTGNSTGKSYSLDYGPINANDINQSLKPMTITIEGDLYTIN